MANRDEPITVRSLLTELDGRGLVCNDPEQVSADLLLSFKIGLDTRLLPTYCSEGNDDETS